MQRYKIALQYLGTNYSGWQRSPTGAKPAVQDVVELALDRFVGEGNWRNPIQCSSRTDAGVHALRNVMHVDLRRRSRQLGKDMEHHSPERVYGGLNAFLKGSQVHVLAVDAVPGEEVEDETQAFHARFSARERRYIYRLRTDYNVFEKDRAWCVGPGRQALDIDAMRKASQVLVGPKQDFTSFRGKDCQAKSPAKTIRKIEVVQAFSELASDYPAQLHTAAGYGDLQEQVIHIHVHAESFLYHMVRNITGTLYAIGSGRLPVSAMEEILVARDRKIAPQMAPACGLYLSNVLYADDIAREKEEEERQGKESEKDRETTAFGNKKRP